MSLQAVRLESAWSERVRYMVVVYTGGHQDTEENILLGMDFINKDRYVTSCLLLLLFLPAGRPTSTRSTFSLSALSHCDLWRLSHCFWKKSLLIIITFPLLLQ